MKLSKETLSILKNFSGLSNSLRIKQNGEILTANSGQSLLAKAVLKEEFEEEMAIFDLAKFLGSMSLFEDPDVKFGPKIITIQDGNKEITLPAGSLNVVLGPKRLPDLMEPKVAFPFTTELLNKTWKASGILEAPDFSLSCDGETLSLNLFHIEKDGSARYSQVIGTSNVKFNAIAKVDSLRFLDDDYEGFIGNKRMICFKSQTYDLLYCVGVLSDSQFDW